MKLRRLVLVLVSLVLLAAACSDDDVAPISSTTSAAPSTTAAPPTTPPPPPSTTTTAPPPPTTTTVPPPPTTTTAAPTTTTTSTTTTTAPFAGDTDSKSAPGPMFSTFGLLENIRFAQREGFTRVVFDFQGTEVPWWEIGYATGPTFEGSGGPPVHVAGDAWLLLTMSSSGYDLSGIEIVTTYNGPDPVPVNTNSVTEVARVEDFEGISQWVIGVSGGEKPYLVGTLLDPPRIYIDIQD